MPGRSPPPSTGITTTGASPEKPGLYLNWEDWLPFFEDWDISLADKKRHIEALWFILECFADANYNLLGPDDLDGQENSGKVLDLTAALRAAVLNSKDRNQQFGAEEEEA